jgi:membrane-bound serine protease (ClpP class)
MAQILVRGLGLLLLLAALWPAQDVVRCIAMPNAADLDGSVSPGGVAVDEALLQSWRREREQLLADGVKTLVLELTSHNGTLEVAEALVDDLNDLRDRGLRVVGFVPEKALGAAALVLMACAEVRTVAAAEIGTRGAADFSGESKALNDRLQSIAVRSAARGTFAASNILRAMVDPERELLLVKNREHTRLVDAAELQRSNTPSSAEHTEIWKAKDQDLLLISGGNTIGVPDLNLAQVRSRDALLAEIAQGAPHSTRVLPLVPRSIFGLDASGPALGLVLIALGLFFLTLEFKTPGVGLAGALALVCFIGGFMLHGADGPPLFITAGLLILGLLLLAVELLVIPGFGVAGLAGILLILFAIYAATVNLPGTSFLEQTIPDSEGDWTLVRAFGLRFLVSIIASVSAAFMLFPALHRLPVFRRAFLAPPVLEPVSAGGVSPAALGGVTARGFVTVAVGTEGRALTGLRPAGRALLGTHEVDVVSDGRFIPEGTPVVVNAVSGSRIEVRPMAEPSR